MKNKYVHVYYSCISVILYRNTTVYLHCDQSRTTPIATAAGEVDGILNYVSVQWCFISSVVLYSDPPQLVKTVSSAKCM